MTTIVLVVLGVLIAAIAAIMIIFFGGDAFGHSSDKAEAATLINNSVQIQAAVQMYHAQEGTMPGAGSGVDDAAMQALIAKKYLTHIPQGVRNADGTQSDWKIDWNYGIARSVLGPASDASGNDTKATRVCKAARAQMHFSGNPQRCDYKDIQPLDPCCIMTADEAAG